MSGRRRCVCRKGAGGGGKGGYTRTRRYRGRRRTRTRRRGRFLGSKGSQYEHYKSRGWPYKQKTKKPAAIYGRRKVRRGSTKFPLGWRNIRKHSSPKGYTEYYERTKRRRVRSRKGGAKNVYGLCTWLAKRNGWSKKKRESCILKMKRNRR